MTRLVILAVMAAVVVLVLVVAERIDDTPVHDLDAAATSPHDRFNSDFAQYVAGANDRTPPTAPTTTTTAVRKSRHRTTVRAASVSFDGAAGQVNGYPCGGDLPPCSVLRCESGGNPTAQNRRSTASGLWQILDSTWDHYGGYDRAYLAPPDVQNDKARALWAGGDGASHWSSCL